MPYRSKPTLHDRAQPERFYIVPMLTKTLLQHQSDKIHAGPILFSQIADQSYPGRARRFWSGRAVFQITYGQGTHSFRYAVEAKCFEPGNVVVTKSTNSWKTRCSSNRACTMVRPAIARLFASAGLSRASFKQRVSLSTSPTG